MQKGARTKLAACGLIGVRCSTDDALEVPAEMALIGEAGCRGDVSDWITLQQKPLRIVDA